MNSTNTELTMLLLQLACLGWPFLSLAALVALRRRPLTALPQALWALIILATPILGACAFWIVQPREVE